MDMDRDSVALPSDGASVKRRGEPPGTVALEAGAQGPRDAPPPPPPPLLLACCLLRSDDSKMTFISSPLLPCCLPPLVRWRLPGLSF
jgi:hypothetical protein